MRMENQLINKCDFISQFLFKSHDCNCIFLNCIVLSHTFNCKCISQNVNLWRVFFLFVTYTIIQNITSSEICALHLTHPSAHTAGAVGSQCCGARGAVGGSVPRSRVSPQSWNWRWRECSLFTPLTEDSCRSRDSNPQARVVRRSIH